MNRKKLVTAIFGGAGLLGVLAIGQVGCHSTEHTGAESATAPAMMAQEYLVSETASARGGAEIWATSCVRCHNSRSPASYSDAEWDVAMLHMRTQARLPADEYRSVLAFLKAAN